MADETRLTPGTILGPYRLIERREIRRGVEVWRGYYGLFDRYVAVEVFPPGLTRRPGFEAWFERETRALSRLNHPNILPVNHFGEQAGCAYVVRPLVGGLTLDHLLGEVWPLTDALLVLEPLAAALDYAHARGLSHCHLTPSNILISEEPRVLLVGFGIAREFSASTPQSAQAGPADDLHALGRIAFELLNGRPLFERETWPPELQSGPRGPLPPPCTLRPDLPPSVVAALFRSLAAEPEERFTDAGTMVRALGATAKPPATVTTAAGAPSHQPAGEAAARQVAAEPALPAWQALPAAAIERGRRLRLVRHWRRAAKSAAAATLVAGLAYLFFVQPALALLAGRGEHAAVPLPDGEVLLVGGCGNLPPGNSLAALLGTLRSLGAKGAEPGRHDTTAVYSPAAGRWSATALLGRARCEARAVALADGRVLVVGGHAGDGQTLPTAERYDRSKDAWIAAGRLYIARREFVTSPLPSGQALAIGGSGPAGDDEPLASTERYDPASNRWILAASLAEARRFHSVGPLADGRLLVVGGLGRGGVILASTERWDPSSNSWSPAAPLRQARADHTLTPLADGRLLAVGGAVGRTKLATAERYDPSTDSWTRVAPLSQPRSGHTATLLPNGHVLVVGGIGPTGDLASAERYDPGTDSWTPAGSLSRARAGHTATSLANGRVLVVGGRHQGDDAPYLNSAELYDPAGSRWSAGPDLPF